MSELRRHIMMRQGGSGDDYLVNEKGLSYLDIGYNLNSRTGLYVDFIIFDLSPNKVHADVIGTSGAYANFLIRRDTRVLSGGMSIFGTIWKCDKVQGGYNYNILLNTRYKIGININGNNEVIVDGVVLGTNPYQYTRNDKCYLFATSGNSSSYTPYAIAKVGIFNAGIYEDGVQIMNLIPHTENAVNGMIDTIGGTFITNAGSGGFTIEHWNNE